MNEERTRRRLPRWVYEHGAEPDPRFSLANERVYKNMWQSPKITPLLQTTHSGSDSTVAWVGVHPSARVVCIQPGMSRETHRNPAYRMLVRNSILWAAGRI